METYVGLHLEKHSDKKLAGGIDIFNNFDKIVKILQKHTKIELNYKPSNKLSQECIDFLMI